MNPVDRDDTLREAAAAVALHDYPAALARLEALLAHRAEDAEALTAYASLLATLHRAEAAIAALDRAIAIAPERSAALLLRGHLLGNSGRHGEALADFECALAWQPGHADALAGKAAALQALTRYAEALPVLDALLGQMPESRQARRERGVLLYRLNRYPEALCDFEWILATDPADPAALIVGGYAAGQLGRHEVALRWMEQALCLDPLNVDALVGSGVALSQLQRLPEALASIESALRIAPDSIDALNARAATLALDNRLEEALADYDRSLTARPGQPLARSDRALVLLALGDYHNGFREWEVRWEIPPLRYRYLPTAAPRWRGDAALDERTILLYHEQGFGDTLQCVRYVPRLVTLGARVLLRVPAELCALMVGLEGIGGVIAETEPLPPHDFQCPLMSLPLAFGSTLDTIPAVIPYLRADHRKVDYWRSRLPATPGLKVGLVWAGKPGSQIAGRRDIPLARLLPLLRGATAAGAVIVSLQNEVSSPDAAILRSLAGSVWLPGLLRDFADTAALIETLDLVISVDTAVAHLAGALGKPVWILNRYAACWRWLRGRSDSPWYPTARLFRQSSPGDWRGAIDEVGEALRAFMAAGTS